jgi:hypothetical protein
MLYVNTIDETLGPNKESATADEATLCQSERSCILPKSSELVNDSPNIAIIAGPSSPSCDAKQVDDANCSTSNTDPPLSMDRMLASTAPTGCSEFDYSIDLCSTPPKDNVHGGSSERNGVQVTSTTTDALVEDHVEESNTSLECSIDRRDDVPNVSYEVSLKPGKYAPYVEAIDSMLQGRPEKEKNYFLRGVIVDLIEEVDVLKATIQNQDSTIENLTNEREDLFSTLSTLEYEKLKLDAVALNRPSNAQAAEEASERVIQSLAAKIEELNNQNDSLVNTLSLLKLALGEKQLLTALDIECSR